MPPGAKQLPRPNEEPAVAIKGKKLEPLEVAPPRTYGMFDLPSPFKGAEFELVARPYGWVGGPKDAIARRVVVRIDSAKNVSGQTDAFPDFDGQNALIWLDQGTKGAAELKSGGVYVIRVAVRPSGKTGALAATSVEVAK